MALKDFLGQLDTANDEHWTMDGLPRLDAVSALAGTDVSRKQVTDAAPGLVRQPLTPIDSKGTAEKAIEAVEKAPEELEAPEAPEPNPEAVAQVVQDVSEMKPEVLPQPSKDDVLMEKLQKDLANATIIMTTAQKIAESEKSNADTAANTVNGINRKIERLQKNDPNYQISGVRRYIEQQNKNRLNRALGLQRFVEQTGIHLNDVAKAVNPKSPIDQAMAGRKPARGSQRPQIPFRR